jgi:hypothetical protein
MIRAKQADGVVGKVKGERESRAPSLVVRTTRQIWWRLQPEERHNPTMKKNSRKRLLLAFDFRK